MRVDQLSDTELAEMVETLQTAADEIEAGGSLDEVGEVGALMRTHGLAPGELLAISLKILGREQAEKRILAALLEGIGDE